ncbi:MAG: hypothetical protein SynsKO_15070 [Synoicihabitans sp.]
MGGHFNQIEIELLRQSKGVFRLHHSELFTFGRDHSDLRNADALVSTDMTVGIVITAEIASATAAFAAAKGKGCSHQIVFNSVKVTSVL